jgi:hypothetical protein
MMSEMPASNPGPQDQHDGLLLRRQLLTDSLSQHPYNPILYLERATVYIDLAYQDLAVGDAYRALLLVDDVLDDGAEYHEQASDALSAYSLDNIPHVLQNGVLGTPPIGEDDGDMHVDETDETTRSLARLASTRSFQILSMSLLLVGCLKSAHSFCRRGLEAAPNNRDLQNTMNHILRVARLRLKRQDISPEDLPDWGLVRREIYPWNSHEPDRYSDETLDFLNHHLRKMAPKCSVEVAELPVLLEGASDTDNYAIIPTCRQLGLFAKEEIAPGEAVLEEYSLLTANNRYKDMVCDACSSELPRLGDDSTAVNCPDCYDTVFCSQHCFEQAQERYHPAVCDRDVDTIARNPDSREADETLHLLLLARLLAISTHQAIHPLEVLEVKYIWGDFVPSASNDIDISPNAGPPPEWTLPFSFEYNIRLPMHFLEKMDIDVYDTLDSHDLWVMNTLYAKFRGTASARKNPRDGRPDVAAVHPFWCLANHDCNPNVSWEWGGRMVLHAREQRVVSNQSGGIRQGDEILSHYCDVSLPVQLRREWARGSLGGWCMCSRCREESAAADGMVSDQL